MMVNRRTSEACPGTLYMKQEKGMLVSIAPDLTVVTWWIARLNARRFQYIECYSFDI